MSKRYSIAEARNAFTRLVHGVERGPAIEITRRGRTVAVLMSSVEYEKLASGRTGFWDAVEAFRSRVDPELLKSLEDVFDSVRDRSPGREADL